MAGTRVSECRQHLPDMAGTCLPPLWDPPFDNVAENRVLAPVLAQFLPHVSGSVPVLRRAAW